MATTTTTNPASVADRLLTYFSKKLLEVQVDTLVMDQGAMKADLPKKASAKTIRFFKPAKASSSLYSAPTATDVVYALTEGTPIANFRENDWTKVDVTLKQYGEATKISDIMGWIDAYEPLKQNIDLMGRDSALHMDTVIRNALVGSTHPDGTTTPLTHASNGADGCEMFVSAANTIINSGTSSTNFTTLSGLTKANGKCFRGAIVAMATRMKVNKTPKFRGNRYLCMLPPQVQHDLVQDADYKTAFQSRGGEGIWKGYLGSLDGFDFVEHTNPFIEDEVYGTYDAVDDDGDGLIYATLGIGAGAYGCPKLEGTKSPLRPQIFINDKPDKSDPLNQFVMAGWKAFYMAMGLDRAKMVALRTKSTFA